jgi:hypothetical protein
MTMVLRSRMRVTALASARAALVIPSLAGPTFAVPARPPNPIKVEGVQFYSGKHFSFSGCVVLGPPARRFPMTTRYVFNYVTYVDWKGRHTDQDFWYSPDRKLYHHSDAYTHAANGPASDCGRLSIAGTRAATLLGTWEYQLAIDGRLSTTKAFTIFRPRVPAPARVVVSSVKFYSGRHFHYAGCTPAGAPSNRFASSTKRISVLLTYARWQGRHRDRDRWYEPSGRLYFQSNSVAYSGRGHARDCGYFDVAGTRAARLLGRWTYRLVVDGHEVAGSSFVLVGK